MNYDGLQDSYWRSQCERVEELRKKISARPKVGEGRVVPDDEALSLGDGRRLGMAVMFLDICGFSGRGMETIEEQDLMLRVLNLFFLVCTGRGEEMTDITPQQYEEVLTYLVDTQKQYPDMLVRARCAPHFKRIAYEQDPNSPITKATGYMGGGCLAGTNYARVTPEGNLTPCPYMPLNPAFQRYTGRDEPTLKGKCADCEYSDICGGCRARPYADHGDWLDADEWCLYQPKGGPKIKVNEIGVDAAPGTFAIRWDDEATARFKRIPYFMQSMVKKSVEAKARERGLSVITPDFMEELRKARFGNEKPVFKF